MDYFFASDSIFSKCCITMLLVSITEFSGASWDSAPDASLSSAFLLCLTLMDPVDWSPPGSSVHGILQATILEQVAMPSSRWSSQPRDQTSVSYTACNGQVVLYYLVPAGKPPAQSWWAVNLVSVIPSKGEWTTPGTSLLPSRIILMCYDYKGFNAFFLRNRKCCNVKSHSALITSICNCSLLWTVPIHIHVVERNTV